MPPRRPIVTKGNRHPTRTRRGLQKEGQGPQSPPVRKSLQRSILLLRRLGRYCRVSILAIPKARKLAPTLTFLDGARCIKKSCPTPRPRAPPRLTTRPQESRPRPRTPSRPTSRPWASSCLTPWVQAPSHLTSRTRVLSSLTGIHTTANQSRSKHMGLGQNSNAREETGMPRCNSWP